MTEFNQRYEATAHNGTAAASAKVVEGYDPAEDRTFRFVQVAKGRKVEAKTTDGDVVEILDFDDEPGEAVTVGSTDVLKPLIEALQDVKQQLETEA